MSNGCTGWGAAAACPTHACTGAWGQQPAPASRILRVLRPGPPVPARRLRHAPAIPMAATPRRPPRRARAGSARDGWVGRVLYQRVHIRDGAVRDRGNRDVLGARKWVHCVERRRRMPKHAPELHGRFGVSKLHLRRGPAVYDHRAHLFPDRHSQRANGIRKAATTYRP